MSFFLGALISFIGSVNPSILTLTTLKVSIEQGKKSGYLFAAGICLIITFQAFISLEFASFIKNNPLVEKYIQIGGSVIFLILSVYFFSLGRQNSVKESSRTFKNPLVGGAVLAFLNVFSLPFYAGTGLALNYADLFEFTSFQINSFSFGSAVGSFGFLFIVAHFSQWIASKISLLANNINYILGGLTGIVALISLISLY